MTLSLKIVGQRDPLLSAVIALGNRNSKTLGMFPQGAFMDHAKRKTILAAVDGNSLAGYVLFRITHKKRLISVTHLCVSPEYRSKGVAIFLLNCVKDKYQNLLQGIVLTCREDYIEASRLWEKFGFKPVDRYRSRSKEEHYLIKWLYDFGNPDLFSDLHKEATKIRALLDCSVVIPLSDDLSASHTETQALFADWLGDEVEFYHAQEIFSELNRDEDKNRASQTRKFLSKFSIAKFRPDERDHVFDSLQSILTGKRANDISDRRQLAECISAGIGYFITLDEHILTHSEDLYDTYSLRVLRPTDFILLLDELSNALDYHSFRLAGANVEYGKLKAQQIDNLLEKFSGQYENESRHDIKARIIRCASDTQSGIVKTVKDGKGSEIGFYSALFDGNVRVQLIRTINNKTALVLFQQMLKDIITLAIKRNCHAIYIDEQYLSEAQKSILNSIGRQYFNFDFTVVSLLSNCADRAFSANRK